ncbi:hypothetical protein NUW54_g2208 [Trametes sanguinea]|uniref:Uncharacterized protein n=2 Tax=Trametes sanguinea TaxID=158606 RepID=A0ACC1Q5I4_9APHY|nr:hypothetical protein NUW54_g4463 [Trametes sanguinea]KAJ3011334.1 hypothetical protein NUW54_g2208 [Trametes sanguinea]
MSSSSHVPSSSSSLANLAEDEHSEVVPNRSGRRSPATKRSDSDHPCPHHSPLPILLQRYIKETRNRLPWEDSDCEQCQLGQYLDDEDMSDISTTDETENVCNAFRHLSKVTTRNVHSILSRSASLEDFKTAYLAIDEAMGTLRVHLHTLGASVGDANRSDDGHRTSVNVEAPGRLPISLSPRKHADLTLGSSSSP